MTEQSMYCVACEMEQLHSDGVCVVGHAPAEDDWDLGLPACNMDEECEACQ